MQKSFLLLLSIVLVIVFAVPDVFGIIAPIRMSGNNKAMLIFSDEIILKFEQVELYFHPIGIWLVEYEAILKSDRSLPVKQTVGFPAGFDAHMIENELYCNKFENFQVYENNNPIHPIRSLVKCVNYVEATDINREMDDGSGVGFLNTWLLNFEPEETKTIKVSFSFNINKPPVNFDTNKKETWYVDSMEWIKAEYSKREQSDFQLPLNLGSFWAFYPDSMVVRSYFSDDWLKIANRSERKYKQEHIKQCEFCEPYGLYSPPEVYLKSPSIEELQQMTRDELKLLKNSFAAKYGKEFKDESLNSFFLNQPWYSVNPGFNIWLITSFDLDNIRLIHEFEKISQ